jgi:hypothetical protein
MMLVMAGSRAGRQDFSNFVGIGSREQVASEEERIAADSSLLGEAGRNSDRIRGEGGGRRWEVLEAGEELKAEQSLEILPSKKERKEEVMSKMEMEEGRIWGDFRESKVFRVDHSLHGFYFAWLMSEFGAMN